MVPFKLSLTEILKSGGERQRKKWNRKKEGYRVDGKRNKDSGRETLGECNNMPPTVVSDNRNISQWLD